MAILSPTGYLNTALDVMQQNSLCALNIPDWDAFRYQMMAKAQQAQTPADTYPLIRQALCALQDGHSFFLPPESFTRTGDAQKILHSTAPCPLPDGQVMDNVAYLKVPAFVPTADLGYTQLADHTQKLIATLDQTASKGWIIDLRGNGGGDMWPMLAGLAPLLDDGILGHFIYEKGPHAGITPWSCRNGVSMWNDAFPCATASTPYKLKTDHPPTALLVDGRTASSAEAVFISFIGMPNMCSFGQPTAGLSTGNSNFDLADGAKLFVTTGVFADRTLQRYGQPIGPDQPVQGGCPDHLPQDPVFKQAHAWVCSIAPQPNLSAYAPCRPNELSL
jgi:carboxyl-terminal processing protease